MDTELNIEQDIELYEAVIQQLSELDEERSRELEATIAQLFNLDFPLMTQ